MAKMTKKDFFSDGFLNSPRFGREHLGVPSDPFEQVIMAARREAKAELPKHNEKLRKEIAKQMAEDAKVQRNIQQRQEQGRKDYMARNGITEFDNLLAEMGISPNQAKKQAQSQPKAEKEPKERSLQAKLANQLFGFMSKNSPILQRELRTNLRPVNTGLLNVPEMLTRGTSLNEAAFGEREGFLNKTDDFLMDMMGYAAPGALSYKAAQKVLGTGAKTAGQVAKEGALAGAMFTGVESGLREAIQPDDWGAKDHTINAVMNIGLGAGIDLGLTKGIPHVTKKIAEKFPSVFKKLEAKQPLDPQDIKAIQQEILLLPEGRPELPAPQTTTSTTAGPRFKGGEEVNINEILELPEPRKQTSIPAKKTDYGKKLDELMNEAKKTEITPGREREVLDDLWSRMAGPNDPKLDDLIDLATPSLKTLNRQENPLDVLANLAKTREKQKYGVDTLVDKLKKETNYVKSNVPEGNPLEFKRERYNPIDTKTTTNEPLNYVGQTNQLTKSKIEGDLKLAKVGDKVKIQNMSGDYKVVGTKGDKYTILSPSGKKTDIPKAYVDRVITPKNPLDAIVPKKKEVNLEKDLGLVKSNEPKANKNLAERISNHEKQINRLENSLNSKDPQFDKKGALREIERYKKLIRQDEATLKQLDTNPDQTFQYKQEPTKPTKSMKERGVGVRSKYVDDLAMVQHVENAIRGAKSFVEGKAYQLQRLVRGGASAAHTDIKTKFNPILKQMKKDKVKSEDVMSYALAKRADWLVRNKEGYTYSSFGKENNEQTVKNTLAKFENDKNVQKYHKEFRGYLDSLVDDMHKVGMIDEGTAKYFKNSEYIPTGRDRTEEGFERAFNDLLPAEYRKAIKELDGGSEVSEIKNPLEQMVIHTFNTRQAIFKNQANKELLKLATDDIDGKFMKVVKKPSDASSPNNIIKVYENGKEVLIDAHKDLAEAVRGATATETKAFAKLVQSYTRLQRTSNTATPEFLIRSLVREIPFAYVTSNAKFSLTKDLPIAMLDLVTNGKLFKDKSLLNKYYESGAGQNTIYAMDRDISAKTVLKAMEGKDKFSKKMLTVVNPKHMFEMLRIMADFTEQVPKLAEFRATLRKGEKGKNWLKESGAIPDDILQRAAYNARDIMDYSRAGTDTRELNKYVAFLNSAIQGKSKVYRSFKKDPVGTALRGTTALTLPTVGMFYMRKMFATEEQERAIQESPDWLRRTFHLVPIPGDPENRLYRIPKPFDLAPIFSTSVETALEHAYDLSDKTTMEGLKEFMSSMTDVPTELTAFSLLYEIPSNYSRFLDRSIVPQNMTGADTKKIEQDTVYTSETARFIAGIVNGFGADETWAASPMMMDYALKKGLGSLGGQAIDFVDILAGDNRNPKPKNSEPKNILSPKDTLERAFRVNTEGRATPKVEDVYKVQANLKRLKGQYDDRGQDFPYASIYTEVNTIQRELSALARQIREIENDPRLTAEQKQKGRNQLSDKRNAIARQFSEKFNSLKGK